MADEQGGQCIEVMIQCIGHPVCSFERAAAWRTAGALGAERQTHIPHVRVCALPLPTVRVCTPVHCRPESFLKGSRIAASAPCVGRHAYKTSGLPPSMAFGGNAFATEETVRTREGSLSVLTSFMYTPHVDACVSLTLTLDSGSNQGGSEEGLTFNIVSHPQDVLRTHAERLTQRAQFTPRNLLWLLRAQVC